jgi:hypothetical protein
MFISSFNYSIPELENISKKLAITEDISNLLFGLNALWSDQSIDVFKMFKYHQFSDQKWDTRLLSSLLQMVNGNKSRKSTVELTHRLIKANNYSRLSSICEFQKNVEGEMEDSNQNASQLIDTTVDLLSCLDGNMLK